MNKEKTETVLNSCFRFTLFDMKLWKNIFQIRNYFLMRIQIIVF